MRKNVKRISLTKETLLTLDGSRMLAVAAGATGQDATCLPCTNTCNTCATSPACTCGCTAVCTITRKCPTACCP